MQTLGAKLQETLLGILQSPGAPANQLAAGQEGQSEGSADSQRWHSKVAELEREQTQLLELKGRQEAELNQLRDQLRAQPTDTPILQGVLVSANAKVLLPNHYSPKFPYNSGSQTGVHEPPRGARVLSRGCTGQGFVLIISRPYCNDKSDQ